MADIENLLKQRASALAPTEGQRQAAARSHAYLRDALATGQMECRIQDDYLSGSYARQTAIRPLDDVDVVFEIDPSYWRRDFFRRLLDQLPAPQAVLETFARAIRYRYSQSSVRRQHHSVGLVMEHLHIDVVPAVVDEDKPMWLRIPDCVAGRWIVTAPKVHSDIAIAINSKTNGLFKPLVRLLKGWNAGLPETTRLKSFAVETLAGRLFSSFQPSSLTEGAIMFLDFASWRGGQGSHFKWTDSCGVDLGAWSGSVPDLAGTRSNLVAGADPDRRAKFTMAARVARDAFLNAASARTLDTAWAFVGPRLMAGMERL